MIKTSNRISLSIISAVGLLNILLIPFAGGGLFPDDFEPQFFDILENFGDAADFLGTTMFALGYLLPVFIAVSCIFMLIAGLVGKKGLCVTAGTVGLVLWFVPFIISYIDASDYGVDFDEFFETLFDVDHGMMAIGTWIALIVFIVYLSMASSAKKDVQNNPYQVPVNGYQYNNMGYQGYQPQNGYQNNQTPYQAAQNPYQNQAAYQPQPQETYQNNYQEVAQAPVETEAAPVYAQPEEVAPAVETAPETYADISSNTAATAEEIDDATVNVNSAENAVKFCPQCGAQVKSEAIFCGSCGHKF